MPTSRRAALPNPGGKRPGQHAGLVLARYVKTISAKGENDDSSVHSRSAERHRLEVLQSAGKAYQEDSVHNLYKRCFERWEDSLPKTCRRFLLNCQSPMIIGLGGESVLETGLTLHHTYGVPYLPGTALKGIAARYARQVWGKEDPSWHPEGTPKGKPNHFRTLFGTTDEGGLAQFLDGWITEDSLKDCLLDDVMTPHHAKYYGELDENVRAPSDFDSPTPIPFLSVTGTFSVAICLNDPRLPSEWLDCAAHLLREGLHEFGIGGKTNAGYGWVECSEVTSENEGESREQGDEPSQQIDVEVVEVSENVVTVMSCDETLMGTIRNHAEIPSECRNEGQILIVKIVNDSDKESATFDYVATGTPPGNVPKDPP